MSWTLDRAAIEGGHGPPLLPVPDNVTLLPVPASSPELDPVERAWFDLRERSLSSRLLADYPAVPDATRDAWDALVPQTGRLASLTAYPYLIGSGLR